MIGENQRKRGKFTSSSPFTSEWLGYRNSNPNYLIKSCVEAGPQCVTS